MRVQWFAAVLGVCLLLGGALPALAGPSGGHVFRDHVRKEKSHAPRSVRPIIGSVSRTGIPVLGHRTRKGVRQDRRAYRNEVRPQTRRARQAAKLRRGAVLDRGRLLVIDHKAYFLPKPRRGHRYVRVDNRIVLVAVATGIVVDILR